MTSTEKNASDVLREMLDERGVEWRDVPTLVGPMTVWNVNGFQWAAIYDADEGGLAVGVYRDYLTPEQAVSATLGSEREAGLVQAIDDVLRNATDTVWVGSAETLVDRMVSLGVYGQDTGELNAEYADKFRELNGGVE